MKEENAVEKLPEVRRLSEIAGLRESPDLKPSSHCYIEKKGTDKPSSLIDLNLSIYKFHGPSAFSEEKSRSNSVLIKITALCYLLLFCNKELLIFLSSPKLKSQIGE